MDAVATLAAAGFDIAHAFDAAQVGRDLGLDLLAGARRGLLIGNTRALWPHFCAARRDSALAADPDPLDRYSEQTIAAAFPGQRVYYGHRRYDGAFLPLQHLAVATGLGALAPSRLVIHPTFGPWFALRAVVLAGEPPPPPRLPIAQPCRCDAACDDTLQRALRTMDWRDWLAVRDRCQLSAWRYSDDQIRFHYAAMARLVRPDGSSR